MINTSLSVLINETGEDLNRSIRDALLEASMAIKKAYKLCSFDLTKVSTKTKHQLMFSKIVELEILIRTKLFDEEYLNKSFGFYESSISDFKSSFDEYARLNNISKIAFNVANRNQMRRGVGLFLLSLHCRRTITLPHNFLWPTSGVSKESKYASELVISRSELLSFIRTVEKTSSAPISHDFKILRHEKRIEWFSTNGTRLLLALGWQAPEDANYGDMIEIYSALVCTSRSPRLVSVYETLAKIIGSKYGVRVPENFGKNGEWAKKLSILHKKKRFELNSDSVFLSASELSSQQAFDCFMNLPASVGEPTQLKDFVSKLPKDNHLKLLSNCWLELECTYFDRRKRESYKQVKQILGFFNLYLFCYLPSWFREFPDTKLLFPTNPNLLVGSVFISRMTSDNNGLPQTFLEMLNQRSTISQWSGNTLYGLLKQLEIFFDFIISYSHHFEGCLNFIQPITAIDYPRSSRTISTNKDPIPRRFLGCFILYVETVKLYADIAIERIMSGALNPDELKAACDSQNGTVIDTRRLEDLVGFLPYLFFADKRIPLRYLPGFPQMHQKELVGKKKRVFLPHPHALNQILVALYTGLRHNHIQWLDLRTYDIDADLSGPLTRLVVNTDKVKRDAWRPHVNSRVIEILHDQSKWRSYIQLDTFADLHFYNNEKNTSYPQILPLFSFSEDGRPHSDSYYSKTWKDLICGFQSVLFDLIDRDRESVPILCKLRPAGIEFFDLEEVEKLNAFRCTDQPKVKLKVQTNITPHAARVSLVSDLHHHLPPELIGRYITGQTAATVSYYYRPTAYDLEEMCAIKGLESQIDSVMNKDFNRLLFKKNEESVKHISADAFDSPLAKGMRKNLNETIDRFRCISIESGGGHESGINILKRRGVGTASFNKTEICPMGNACPDEIILLLKGTNRCSVCPIAIRSIDHIPAISVRKKFTHELLVDLSKKIEAAQSNSSTRLSNSEIEMLDQERGRIAEDLVGWQLCEEVLYDALQKIQRGEDSRKWVIEKPAVLLAKLERVEVENEGVQYLFSRLQESIQYPGFQSPLISAQFDLARRKILACCGSSSVSEIFSLNMPVDSAAECAGIIRSVVETHDLTLQDIEKMLDCDYHLNITQTSKMFGIADE